MSYELTEEVVTELLKFANDLKTSFENIYENEHFEVSFNKETSVLHLIAPWFVFVILDNDMTMEDGLMVLLIETKIDSYRSAHTVKILSSLVGVQHWKLGGEYFIDEENKEIYFGTDADEKKQEVYMKKRGFVKCVYCDKYSRIENINTKGMCPNCPTKPIVWS